MLTWLRSKRDIKQQYFKIVDLYFVKCESFLPTLSFGSRQRDATLSGWKFQLNDLVLKGLKVLYWNLFKLEIRIVIELYSWPSLAYMCTKVTCLFLQLLYYTQSSATPVLIILYFKWKHGYFLSDIFCVRWRNNWKWNEMNRALGTYRLNWARETSWGWWDEWNDTVLQTQDSKPFFYCIYTSLFFASNDKTFF